MDSELEVIRDQMHQTRASLSDKLDALESQVRDTVQSASETVTATVDSVKEVTDTVVTTVEGVTDTVKGTVEGVTDTVQTVAGKLDITPYVERAPWLSLGAAVAVGFAGGYLLGGSAREPPEPRRDGKPSPRASEESEGPQEGSSFLGLDSLVPDGLREGLQEGIQTALTGLQGLAVSAVMGVVREMVQTSLPGPVQQEFTKLVDGVTTRLGGKTLGTGWRAEESAPPPARLEEAQGKSAGLGPTTPPESGQPPPTRRQERRKAGNGRR